MSATTHTAGQTAIRTATGVNSAPEQGEAHPPGEVIMRARGLEMSFGQTRALRGVDLDLLTGEVLAVTGPSGSGKSTLLHVMAGVLVPDAGRLLDLQRAEHMARMRELTRLKQDGDLRTVLLADHALFHIEADLRWMETTAARLNELREEVRS